MLISKIQVLNYKSFRDSGWIEFRAGINIITGQNSAGKTALLEALALNFQNIPHRSISILPTPSSLLKAQSQTNFSLSFTKNERQSILAQIPLPYFIPPPSAISSNEALQLFQIWLDKPEDEMLSASTFGDSAIFWEIFDKKSAFGLYEANIPLNYNDGCQHIQIQRDATGDLVIEGTANQVLAGNSFTTFLRISQQRIYRFLAERLNVGSCGRTLNHELLPNASNLPEVLGILQGKNPVLFELFNEYVSIIFPQIKRISILQGGEIEIKVWHISPSTFRDDLSFPLSACGTGVGQVLSILFVILTAQFPRVIIIDEPQSFLHPGAAKKLIEIFKEIGKNGRFPEHQYIISTHSPTIIAAAEPATITMLRYAESCETLVSTMNSEKAGELRTLLDEVGVSLSDVFGMDKILWVEGPT